MANPDCSVLVEVIARPGVLLSLALEVQLPKGLSHRWTG